MAINGSSHPKLLSLYFLWLNTSTIICLTDTAASIKYKPTALYTSMTLLQELESIPLVGLLDAHRSFLTYPFLPTAMQPTTRTTADSSTHKRVHSSTAEAKKRTQDLSAPSQLLSMDLHRNVKYWRWRRTLRAPTTLRICKPPRREWERP